jgi:hypothetical protein
MCGFIGEKSERTGYQLPTLKVGKLAPSPVWYYCGTEQVSPTGSVSSTKSNG